MVRDLTEKLTAKLCEIPAATNALLDAVVEPVHEKAIEKTSFSCPYSDMHHSLKSVVDSDQFTYR